MAAKKTKKPEFEVLQKNMGRLYEQLRDDVDSLLNNGLDATLLKRVEETLRKLDGCSDGYGGTDLVYFLLNDVEELGYVVYTAKAVANRQKSYDKINASVVKLTGENDKLREQIAKLKNKPVLTKAPAKKKKAVKKGARVEEMVSKSRSNEATAIGHE